MKLCLVSPSDSKQIISDKLFEKPVKVVRVIKSGDLFDCCDNEHIDGKLLLDIVGNGCLYIKPCVPSAIVKPTNMINHISSEII